MACRLTQDKVLGHKRYSLFEATITKREALKYKKKHIKDGHLSRIVTCKKYYNGKNGYGVYVKFKRK